ncbi:MAG: hypothetical protein K8T20_02440 [Planctomycetes bacterium]|nr:hypothetical protein [Planctomycetota bacterium]
MKTLLLALLPALAFADSAALRKAVVENREQWVGKKRDFAKFPVLDADGKSVLGKEGDFSSEFVENGFNPIAGAKLDKAKLVEGFKKLQSWAAGERKAAEALLKTMDALVAEAEAGKPLSLSSDGDDELSVAARGAGTADGLAEYLGVLRRWRSIDQWRAMTLQWLEEDGKRGQAYLAAHPDLPGNSTSAIFVAGGEHVVRSKLEIQSLQRLAEDLLKTDAAEKTASKRAPHGLPPSLRDAWDKLVAAAGDKDLTALLEKALEDRWHNATVAHQLWKYESAKAIPQIAGALKQWKTRGGTDILGLLEVFHARQGTVFGDFNAADRFMEKLTTFDTTGERAEIFKRAQQTVGQWYSGMSYKHALTVAKCFEEKHADCFNCGNMVAALMGNQGFDGLYPIMESFDGDSHLQTACRIGDRFVGGDGMGMGAGDFPRGYAGSGGIRLVVLWFRTVDGWVDAQILDVGKGELTKRVVPYYGQAEEKTEAVK